MCVQLLYFVVHPSEKEQTNVVE